MHHVDNQHIVEPTNQHNQDDASVHKAHGNSPPKKSSSNKNNTKDSMGQNNIVYLHLLFACRNQKSLELLSSKQNIIGFPRCRRNETYKCPICLKMKYGKIERDLLSSQIHLGPGQIFSMDFSFLNTTSIRGFSAYLSATCFTTAYPFGFPVRNKRSPLDLIIWLIDVMERQGRKVLFLRFDEGDELVRNYEVGKLLVEKHVIMQSTGAFASSLNGKDERSHRTYSEMMRCMLHIARQPQEQWCYAFCYSIFLCR